MGKWIGLLAVGGAVAFGATLFNRRTGRRIKWNKLWNRTFNMMGNRNMRRMVRRGRRMIQSWT